MEVDIDKTKKLKRTLHHSRTYKRIEALEVLPKEFSDIVNESIARRKHKNETK